MNNTIKVIMSKFERKIETDYYNLYCGLMQTYANAMDYLWKNDKKTFDIFCNWFFADGTEIFDTISDCIQNDKLNSRFNSFMEIYKGYLEDAVEDDCKQSVLDFLYIIPKKMKEDFGRFGFLENKRQEFVWEYRDLLACDSEYQYFWKPGRGCQVLLLC